MVARNDLLRPQKLAAAKACYRPWLSYAIAVRQHGRLCCRHVLWRFTVWRGRLCTGQICSVFAFVLSNASVSLPAHRLSSTVRSLLDCVHGVGASPTSRQATAKRCASNAAVQPFFPRKPAHVAYCNSSTRISAFRLLRSRWPTLRPHCFSVSRFCASLSLSAVDGNVMGRFEILAACPNSRLVRDRAPLCFVMYIVSVILGKYAGAHPQSHSRSDQRLPKRTPAVVAAALIKAEPSRLS